MTSSQEVWAAFTLLLSIGMSSAGWFYNRLSKTHERIDKVVNHMTDEDNKLHTRVDVLRVIEAIGSSGYFLQLPPNGAVNARLNFGGG